MCCLIYTIVKLNPYQHYHTGFKTRAFPLHPNLLMYLWELSSDFPCLIQTPSPPYQPRLPSIRWVRESFNWYLLNAKTAADALKDDVESDGALLCVLTLNGSCLISSPHQDDALVEDSGKKGKELRVLDPKTSQNISILLGTSRR